MRGSVGRVVTGLCAGCEERSNRPTDLTIYVPAPEAELGLAPASAIVGRLLRGHTVEAAWEPNRGGRALAHLESALGRAADLLLRGAPVRRVTAGTAELRPVGIYDARNERIARIDDRPAIERWLRSTNPT